MNMKIHKFNSLPVILFHDFSFAVGVVSEFRVQLHTHREGG